MSENPHQIFARYNRCFNTALFDILDRESIEQPDELLIQLNHIYVMDQIWLSRFRGRPERTDYDMDELIFANFGLLKPARINLDNEIHEYVDGLSESNLEAIITFRTKADNVLVQCELGAGLINLFNHQSLHRGEILRLLSQAGIDFGNSDILPLIIRILGEME